MRLEETKKTPLLLILFSLPLLDFMDSILCSQVYLDTDYLVCWTYPEQDLVYLHTYPEEGVVYLPIYLENILSIHGL